MSMKKDRFFGRNSKSMTAVAVFVAAILVSVLVFYPASVARASPATVTISCSPTPSAIGPCPASDSPRWGLDEISLDVQSITVPADGNYTVTAGWGENSSNSFTYSYTVAGPNSASFGPHVYQAGTGDRTVQVIVQGPNPLPIIVDSGSSTAKVQKHDVVLTAPDLPASKKWFFGFNVPNNPANPIVITDTDAGTPISGLSSSLFTFTGSAVDNSPVTAAAGGTDPDGKLPSTELVASENTGTGKEVKINFLGNNLYKMKDASSTMTIEKHDVALTAPDLPASKKWFFGFNVPNNPANPIVITDTDAGTPISGLSSSLFTFTGSAVDGSSVTADGIGTNEAGEVPSTHLIASQNTGTGKEVKINFLGNNLYNLNDPVSTMTIDRHATEFRDSVGTSTLGPTLPASAKWYFEFTASGPYLVDKDKGGVDGVKDLSTPRFLVDKLTKYSGTAIDGSVPISASANTDGSGKVPATILIASSPAGANRNVLAHFAGDALEGGLYSAQDSTASTMTIDRHVTSLTIGDVPTTPWGQLISPSGLLSDSDRAGEAASKQAVTPIGPASKPITFTGSGVGTVASTNTATAIYTTGGKTVSTTSYPGGGTLTVDQELTFDIDPSTISVIASVSGQGSGVTPGTITPTILAGGSDSKRIVSLACHFTTSGILNNDALGTIRVEVAVPNSAASLTNVAATGTDSLSGTSGGATLSGSQSVTTVIAAPGSYFTTGNAPPAPCNPGVLPPPALLCTPNLGVQAHFADDPAEGGLYTGISSGTDTYDN